MDPLTTEEVTALEEYATHQGVRNGHDILAQRLIATIRDRERERDEFKVACVEAENAIRACPALREWGPSTAQHLASRVNNVCRLYDSAVYTITQLDKERDDKEYARKEWAETAHRVIMERDELQRKLDAAINSLKNVSMVARRERRTVKTEHDADAWGHIIRFCEEAGIKSSVLRDGLAAPAREGEGGTE